MAYPLERKEAILNKLLPPSSKAIAEVAKEEGIPIGTIYAWLSSFTTLYHDFLKGQPETYQEIF